MLNKEKIDGILDAMEEFFTNSTVKMIVALTIVGMLSGAVLVFVYNYAMPKIKVNVTAETDRAISKLFPDSGKVEKMENGSVFKVSGKNGTVLGYAFLAEGNGYQGVIKLLVGADAGLDTLKGMEVLESQETPGLGAEISGDKFKDQFLQLPVSHKIEYVKNQKPEKPYQIEAITGATISSRAVVNIINKELETVRKELGK